LSPVNQILGKKWHLINDSFSLHPNKVRKFSENKIGVQPITEPSAIAEELNLHFSNIGERLGSEIPSFNVEPESYIESTDTTFSMKAPTLNIVHKLLLKLHERKVAILDNIPSKVLKMVANIVAPSLAQIFTNSISFGIFPTEWQLLTRVTPIFKKGKKGRANQLSANTYRNSYIRPA